MKHKKFILSFFGVVFLLVIGMTIYYSSIQTTWSSNECYESDGDGVSARSCYQTAEEQTCIQGDAIYKFECSGTAQYIFNDGGFSKPNRYCDEDGCSRADEIPLSYEVGCGEYDGAFTVVCIDIDGEDVVEEEFCPDFENGKFGDGVREMLLDLVGSDGCYTTEKTVGGAWSWAGWTFDNEYYDEIVCISGDEKCVGEISSNCVSNEWQEAGRIHNKCGYRIPYCGDGNLDDGEDYSTCPIDAKGEFCGNGVLDEGEDYSNCFSDSKDELCGNGIVDEGETCGFCKEDLGDECLTCGDGIASEGETCQNCPEDIDGCPYCGDGIANGDEQRLWCPQDVLAEEGCGNGKLDDGENQFNCPEDAGGRSYCGDGEENFIYYSSGYRVAENCWNCPSDVSGCVNNVANDVEVVKKTITKPDTGSRADGEDLILNGEIKKENKFWAWLKNLFRKR